MIPLQMALNAQECETFTQFARVLRTFGIEGSVSRGKATIRTVSLPLRQQNLPHLIPELLRFLADNPEGDEKAIASRLAEMLVSEPAAQSKAQAVQPAGRCGAAVPATGAQTAGRFIAIN